MQFKAGSRKKGKALINITSLIDVLFLLLIFLMVSSTFLEQPGIQLELPEAQSSVLVEQKEFTLYVNRNGDLFLNDIKIFGVEVMTLAAPVVEVMDAVKNSGVKKLIVGTRIKE